jgi:hypothetical protein
MSRIFFQLNQIHILAPYNFKKNSNKNNVDF